MRYSFYWSRRLAVSFIAALFTLLLFEGVFAIGAAALVFAGAFILYTRIGNSRIRRKYGLSRKEYYYILDQLKEARLKLSRLQHLFLKMRSLRSLKRMIELHSLVKRIYSIVKKEPQRFYDIEPFFYSHLDSVVELTEKSALLSRNKIKDPATKQSLIETTETLDDLSKTLEADLRQVLARDIEHLTIELDVARQQTGRLKKPFIQAVPEPKPEVKLEPNLKEKLEATLEPAEEKGDQKNEQRNAAATGTRYGRKNR